ncbi:MAG: 4-hydroxy-tetrahydrodipicolinate reductase [Pseudomonadota bacterium]
MPEPANPLRIAIAGANGRMGRAIFTAARGRADVAVACGIERAGDASVGADFGVAAGGIACGVSILDDPDKALSSADVAIDFSAPEAAAALAERAAGHDVAMVIGATGFDAAQERRIAAAAQSVAIVKSGNMSLGVNLLTALVEKAAAALPPAFDIEIVEAHHRRKVDAPSGTALMLGEAAAAGRSTPLQDCSVYDRTSSLEPRTEGAIGFAVIRGGGVIGEHEARFLSEKEVVTLGHHALDRSLFADGALAAAAWTRGRTPGLYSMRDVLNLS